MCGFAIYILSGVEFLDGPWKRQANNTPPLHHFRSHTLQSEEQHLRKCWKECLTEKIEIPHHAIRIYDEDGDLLSVKHTSFLESDTPLQMQNFLTKLTYPLVFLMGPCWDQRFSPYIPVIYLRLLFHISIYVRRRHNHLLYRRVSGLCYQHSQ